MMSMFLLVAEFKKFLHSVRSDVFNLLSISHSEGIQ